MHRMPGLGLLPGNIRLCGTVPASFEVVQVPPIPPESLTARWTDVAVPDPSDELTAGYQSFNLTHPDVPPAQLPVEQCKAISSYCLNTLLLQAFRLMLLPYHTLACTASCYFHKCELCAWKLPLQAQSGA